MTTLCRLILVLAVTSFASQALGQSVKQVHQQSVGAENEAGLLVLVGTKIKGKQSAKSLPIPKGLWVVAGEDCSNPPNAAWKIYDGQGLFGAQSSTCTIKSVSKKRGQLRVDQTCVASYNGSKENFRDTIVIKAPKRIGIVEDGSTTMQDFNWCGPRLRP